MEISFGTILWALNAIAFPIFLILFWRNLENERKQAIYPIYYQIYLNTLLFALIAFFTIVLDVWYSLFPEQKQETTGFIRALLVIVFEAFTSLNSTGFLILLFLLLCTQRFLIFSTSERVHQFITGNWLKFMIGIVYFEAVVMLFVRAVCSEIYLCVLMNCTSPKFLIILNVHLAITITAPFLSLYFNYRVYKKVSILSYDISDTRRTIELNIILQSTPVIISCAIRSVLIFLIYIDQLPNPNTFNIFICKFPGPAYIFIPLGYIFGNIDRLKRIKRFITRAQLSAEVRPVSSTHSQHPIVMANQSNVIDQ